MNIVIRTDASSEIGTGHVRRCLTLADQLKENGAQVSFVCRGFEGNLISLIRHKGFYVHSLESVGESKHLDWIKNNWNKDAEETKECLNKVNEKIKLLIVDHYGLDASWEKQFYSRCDKIMVIDDLGDRLHSCDMLVDQNFKGNREKYQPLLASDTIGLYGQKYLILRKEFSINRKKIFSYDSKNIKIHVFFGGFDQENYTSRFSELILKNFINVTIKAVVGNTFSYVNNLKKIKEIYGDRFEWVQNIQDMAAHMKQCDIAFGAPGTATWERACIGLPAVYLSTNDNQVNILNELNKLGFCIFLGRALLISDEFLVRNLDSLLCSKKKLENLFYMAHKNVDGLGTERIVNQIYELIGDLNE